MNQERLTDIGLLVMRVMLAVVFMYHGAPKLFGGLEGFAGYLGSMGVPAPKVAAFLAALSEFGGGLVLLAGIGFRYALPPLFFPMIAWHQHVASLTVNECIVLLDFFIETFIETINQGLAIPGMCDNDEIITRDELEARNKK